MKNAILRKKIEELKSDIKALITGSFLERSSVEMKWKYLFDIDKCFEYFHTITIKPKAPFKMQGIYPLITEQQTNEPSKPAETENYKWTESLISKLALFVLETSDSEKYETLDEVISVFKINNPSPAEEKVDFSVAKAVNILTDALNADPDFRETYKANIAMMFWDEFHKVSPLSGYRSNEIHEIANKAADRFLNHWCHKNEKSQVEEKGYATPKLKEFIDGLKKFEPSPFKEDMRYAGFIHNVSFGEAGSIDFNHSTGKVVLGTSDEEVKKRSEEKKKEEPKKYPEGILSFKKADGTFGYHIEKLTIIPYQEWCEYHLESKPVATIHSVRNSKGEVFTVGDKVGYADFEKTDYTGNITAFEIQDFGGQRFIASSVLFKDDRLLKNDIRHITKVQPQPSWKEQIISVRDINTKISYIRNDNNWFKCNSDPTNGNIKADYIYNHLDQYEILTVKNKAGIELSVWDNTNYGKIVSFTPWPISETTGYIKAISDGGSIAVHYPIDDYVKSKPKQPLFTSEDGYKVFEGDVYYQITKDGSGYGKNTATPPSDFYTCILATRFKLVSNAQNYIEQRKPKPLFKTEDGFEVFNGDKVYFVGEDLFPLSIWLHDDVIIQSRFKYFKVKSNAKRYITDHKKSISWNELEEFILRATWNQKINTGRDFLMIYYEDFINRFKPKK